MGHSEKHGITMVDFCMFFFLHGTECLPYSYTIYIHIYTIYKFMVF